MIHKIFQLRYVLTIMLLFISILPLIDLFHPGLPITHDGRDHVARIANFYQNLVEGNIVPRWAPNLNWGYGHPILMFLYPLPSYVASFFHLLGFSLVDSLKLVFGIAFVASGFAMYFWVRNFLDTSSALLSASLYMIAPYRFIDLYVRGAIGEHVAFIFPPLIMYFLLKLSKKYNMFNIIGGSLSFAALVLSHNAISLMFLPLFIAYGCYLFVFFNKKITFLLNASLFILLGLGISAFFWAPAFFEGKFTLRDVVTSGTYYSSFVPFKNFLFGEWSYGITGQFSVQVGILHWILVIGGIIIAIYLYRKKNNLWIIMTSLLIIFGLTLFIMMQSSNVLWTIITTLQKFQFPWRFLSVIVFTTSVIGGIVIFSLPKELRFKLVIPLLVLLLFFNKDYWYAKEYKEIPESFFTSIYNGTTDTGESAPIWSVRFMERPAKAPVDVIEGNAKISNMKRISTQHEYTIEANTKSRIVENTLFFPGWQVLVDGKQVDLQFQDPTYRGLMTYFVEKGNHSVVVKFGETKLRAIADFISLACLVIIGIYAILKVFKIWPQRFRLF